MPHVPFALVDMPTAEVRMREAEVAALTSAVRELIDAGVRTTVPVEELRAARAEIEAATQRLAASQIEGSFGVQYNNEGHYWYWGNAAMGLANAIAPPLQLINVSPGHGRGEAVCGAAYEGAPGLLHGGISALLLDQVMSETATENRRIIVTGWLKLTFKHPTRLGPISIEARNVGEDGRKISIEATLSDSEGVSIEAEGLFINPKSATSPVL